MIIADGVKELRVQLAIAARRLFEPPSLLTVSEAADRYRVLSAEAGAVEPGRWRTSRVPYLREIMDSLGDPTCQRVVFVKSSQVGGSEVGLNWALHTMLVDPAPMLVLFPSDESLKSWSTVKLDSMIRNCEALRGRVYDDEGSGRRDKRNTIKKKSFPGGYFAGLTARSSAQLRSWTAPRGICEEFEDYTGDVNNQGDPVELMERALRTFMRSGGKLFLVTTMSVRGFSRGEREYEASDQRRCYIPCPQCNGEFVMAWREEDGTSRFRFDMQDGEHVVPGSTRYECPHCEHLIEHRWKEPMVAAHRWVPHVPSRTQVRGYHIWTAYSPFVEWDQIADKFLQSRKLPEKLKVFDNTWAGVTFKETTEVTKPETLKQRAEEYGVRDGGEVVEVPHGVGVLTAAIDVQVDRLEWGVYGWGAGEESWAIEWGREEGDPAKPDVYDRALAAVFRGFQHASGASLRPAICVVDAGFMTSEVVRAVDRWRAKRCNVIAIVGREGRGRAVIERPAAQKWKRSRANSRPLHVVHTDSVKDILLLSRLLVKEPGPGFMHWPLSLDPVAFDHLTSEELRTVWTGPKGAKRAIRKWVLLPDRRNEWLDLTCYCLAGLYELGLPVIARLSELAGKLSEFRPTALAQSQAPPGQATTGAPGYGMVSKGIDW